MTRAQELPENRGVLAYLGQGEDPGSVSVVAPPPDDVDIRRLGAHPDIVEWRWWKLNAALPGDARALVAGGAGLVHPDSGLILAVALGTQYALRLTGGGRAAADERGYETVHTYRSVDRTLDLAAEFGPGWFFGDYDQREGEWLAEAYGTANL